MNRMIIVGSPRVDGRSANLADQLFEACIADCPDDAVTLASVATLDIQPCRACGVCGKLGVDLPTAEEGEIAENDAPRLINYSCPLSDDMKDIAEALDAADELLVVCPLYFAGPPAQMKCLIDRLQPYFHSDLRHGALRPAALHVVGDGHSPYGWEPLADILSSALVCAGFELQTVLDWTGRMAEDGEILADADEYTFTLDGDSQIVSDDCWDSYDEDAEDGR